MPAKRLIGMITVRGGWAVQSFGFRRYLPLGRPTIIAENLDRWGVDEIMVIDIGRSAAGAGPNLELVRELGRRGLSTPLAYGGGVRDAEDAAAIVAAGAERVCLDTLLDSCAAGVQDIAACVGAQAVIAAVTMRSADDGFQWIHHVDGRIRELDRLEHVISSRCCSELLVIDTEHEGGCESFDERLLDMLAFGSAPLIAFGGITTGGQIRRITGRARVVGVAVGNSLSYAEHRVQSIRGALSGEGFREPHWRFEAEGANE